MYKESRGSLVEPTEAQKAQIEKCLKLLGEMSSEQRSAALEQLGVIHALDQRLH